MKKCLTHVKFSHLERLVRVKTSRQQGSYAAVLCVNKANANHIISIHFTNIEPKSNRS